MRRVRRGRAQLLRRDLVPVKAAMVDEEMTKLGLSLTIRVLSHAKSGYHRRVSGGHGGGRTIRILPRNYKWRRFPPGGFANAHRQTPHFLDRRSWAIPSHRWRSQI